MARLSLSLSLCVGGAQASTSRRWPSKGQQKKLNGNHYLRDSARADAGHLRRSARATLDGKNPGGWVPEQKITLPEAVEAYTMGAAFAEFQEREKGSITPGKLADMVILADNIFELKPEAIRNVKVQTTIVGGKVIYGHR